MRTIPSRARRSLAIAACATASLLLAGPSLAVAAGASPIAAPKLNVKHPYLAPELTGLDHWINTPQPLTLASLRGKVVIVDFWTFGCINCQRTLPHLRALYAKYHAAGLEIVGVHAPEFGYEQDAANVEKAVTRNKLAWPIAQDNSFATWKRYQNLYWPAFYFIDKSGRVRHTHDGEGEYDKADQVVAALLAE